MTATYLRDAARRRAARHGSYQKALQALTRYDTPHPSSRTPAGIDWTPLHGIEVDLDNGVHQIRGVVLPPDDVRPGADILRVAVTTGHTGLHPAEVTYLDARHWTITPMPADAERRFRPSRRRTRGPRGLPLYRTDDLPAAALATRTMLRTQYRARPAEGQTPIAEYYAGRDYYDLYAIDDAQPLPALPATRQAAWIHARTCADCAQQSTRRYDTGFDGKPHCRSCWRRAADDWWNTGLQAAQHAAIDWARQLLADPDAILVNNTGSAVTRLIVTHLATGEVLHDLTALPGDIYTAKQPWVPEDERLAAETATSRTELADHLAPLQHRRIINWRGAGLRSLVNQLHDLLPGGVSPVDPWRPAPADDCDRWYGYWLHQPAHRLPGTDIRWAPNWNQHVELRGRALPLPGTPGWTAAHDHLPAQARADHAQLQRMAAGPPTPDLAGQPPQRTQWPVYVYSHHLAKLTAPPSQ